MLLGQAITANIPIEILYYDHIDANAASEDFGFGLASSMEKRIGILKAEPKPIASPLGKPEISLRVCSLPFSIACLNALMSRSLVKRRDPI